MRKCLYVECYSYKRCSIPAENVKTCNTLVEICSYFSGFWFELFFFKHSGCEELKKRGEENVFKTFYFSPYFIILLSYMHIRIDWVIAGVFFFFNYPVFKKVYVYACIFLLIVKNEIKNARERKKKRKEEVPN